MTKDELIDALMDLSPWEIAQRLGIRYTGDMNPFDHDGTFYETSNWEKYGYACCVRIISADGRRFSESATIHRPGDLAKCIESAGLDPELELNTEAEIESVLGYWGAETDEDFSGQYLHNFPDDVSERRFWKHCAGWILGLASE